MLLFRYGTTKFSAYVLVLIALHQCSNMVQENTNIYVQVFLKELYNFERVYKFIQRTCTMS
jgi:hypothetical protein